MGVLTVFAPNNGDITETDEKKSDMMTYVRCACNKS